MSFFDYFDRFAPTSWFDSGLTEVDEIGQKGAATINHRDERTQSKVGGLLWGAAASVAMAGALATGVVTGSMQAAVDRVAVAPIPATVSAHFRQLVTSHVAAHDFAPPGVWANAMSSIASMRPVDEAEYVDLDSFF